MKETSQLDALCIQVMRTRADAAAVLVLVLTRDDRAEIASANETANDLAPAALLRRLADVGQRDPDREEWRDPRAMNTYKLRYEWEEIAEVAVDQEKAMETVKQMLAFYDGPADPDETDADLLRDWLRRLGMFILRNERAPEGVGEDGRNGDEGWAPLDGRFGIKIVSVTPYEFSSQQIEIEKDGEGEEP